MQRFEVIVSNPPYIAAGDPHLRKGDLRFEPAAALASGIDGLDAIRLIAAQARAHIEPGGWLLVDQWRRGERSGESPFLRGFPILYLVVLAILWLAALHLHAPLIGLSPLPL